MQVQPTDNRISFSHHLKFDEKIITKATAEEKHSLAKLKTMYKRDGVNENIRVKYEKGTTINEIIRKLIKDYVEIIRAQRAKANK